MRAPTYSQRLAVLLGLCVAGGVLILVRSFSLQVSDRGRMEARARAQAAGWRPVYAPRGRIVDADGESVAHGSAAFDLVVRVAPWRAERHECRYCCFVRYFKPDDPRVPCPQCRRVRAKGRGGAGPTGIWRFADRRRLDELARLLDVSEADLRARVRARVKDADKELKRELSGLSGAREQRRRRMAWADLGWRARTVVRDVSYEAALEVQMHPARYPGFRVDTVQSRRYPGGAAFVHILGRVMRDRIRSTDPEGGLRYVDVERGVRGLERAFDAELNSVTGWVRFLRDPRGGQREIESAARAVRGLDLRLTMRRDDQQRAMEALGRDEGALVVLDARTGAVLALASAPAYAPEDYVRTLQAWRKRKGGPTPLVDRASSSAHIPGSIMKPFTALGALRSGVLDHEHTVHCDGFFRARDGRVLQTALKCASQHGDTSLHRALVKSCNIYFQTAMKRMYDQKRASGPGLAAYFRTAKRFGFGEPTGIELGGTAGRFSFGNETTWYQYMATAIGQGPILVSPVQIARAYAGLATGSLPRVHVVAQAGPRPADPRGTPLGIDEAHLAAIRSALFQVPVSGTAKDFGLARFGLACKTGTAQIRGGSRDPRYNSWIAGFAPARAGRPPIAFALVVLNARRHAGDECGPRLAAFLERFYSRTAKAETAE